MDPTDDPTDGARRRVYDGVAAFFATLAAHGVVHVVVSPGSRSTPLAVSAHRSELHTWVHLDERSAGFFALGLARATGRPVVLVCTSGTAVANYLPAVVEANHGGVPLIVVTADRPPELRRFGAGQTIDQVGIFGSNCRFAAELPVAGEAGARAEVTARWAARAVAEATGGRPGPVHLNWPFREPLEPPAELPAPRLSVPRAVTAPTPATPEQVAELVALAVAHERGVVAAGPADHDDGASSAIARFAAAAGWPVVAEPPSQLRRPRPAGPPVTVIATADSFLRHPAVGHELTPDVIVRVGLSPTTKPLRLWAERERPPHVVLVGAGTDWADPSSLATTVLLASPTSVFEAAADALEAIGAHRGATSWTARWVAADEATSAALDRGLDEAAADGRATGPAVVRALAGALPDHATLYVSNSMPVRDVDTYWPRHGARVLANRGASGIDGVTSSALGVAAAGAPTVLLTGDLAFLHDLGGFLAARRLGLPFVAVVVDNDGGGIFSYLPVAGALTDGFQELFHTPHGHDLAALARAAGATVTPVDRLDELPGALARAVADLDGARPGTDAPIHVVHVRLDHAHDLAVHRAVQARVTATLDAVELPPDRTAHSHRVTTPDGVTLHARVWPGSPTSAAVDDPVVVLHGFTGSASTMAPLAETLARRGLPVTALDIVGHGRSDRPAHDAPYAVGAVVDQLAAAVERLHGRPVHVVGYSMGGRLALHLAAARPDLVAGLVLIGASPGLSDPVERQARVDADHALAEHIVAAGLDRFVDEWAATPLFASQARLGPVVAATMRLQRLGSTADALARSLRGSGTGAQEPLHERLPTLDLPVLLLAGEHDTKFRILAEEMAAALPCARTAVIPGAGHATHLEAPAATAAAIVHTLRP